MNAADRLAEIEARIEAATEGPWFVMGGHPPLDEYLIDSDSTFIASTHIDTERGKNDATFIADARTDLPATTKALRAVLELHEAVEVYEYDDTNGVFAVDADGNHIVTHRLCRECTPDYTLELLGNCEWTEDVESVYFPCPTVVAITEALDGAA